MEGVVVFRDLLDEFAELALLGVELALDLVELDELLRAPLLQLADLRVLGPELRGGVLDAPEERLLEPLEPRLVGLERLDLGLDLLDLALAGRLQQGDVLPLLRDLLLQLLARLLEPLDLLDDHLLVRLPQLALQPVVLLQLHPVNSTRLPRGSRS